MKSIKFFAMILAVATVFFLASSCKNRDPSPTDGAESTANKDHVSSDCTTKANGDGEQTYTFVSKIDSAIINFDYGTQSPIDPIYVSFDIPSYVTDTDKMGDDATVLYRYSASMDMEVPALEIHGCFFKVKPDFDMDATVHSYTDAGGSWFDLTDAGYTVTEGTAASGCGYVLYETEYPAFDLYNAHVYLRLTDDYIFKFKFTDEKTNYEYLQKIIDSVTLVS